MEVTDLADHIYVISLPHRHDRRDALEANWKPLGLEWEYVDGVRPLAADIKWTEMRGMEAYGKPDWLRTDYVIGAVGCKRAGIRALETFLNSEHETALICQDDCRWLPNACQILAPIDGYPDGWDMIYLSANLRKSSKPHDEHWMRMVAARLCTSIIWNRQSAERAVSIFKEADCEWDLAQERMMRGLNVFSPHQWTCAQAKGPSDIVGRSMVQPNT